MKTLRENVIRAMKCPVCGARTELCEGASNGLRCNGIKTHCYDLSSAGYVNLCKPGQSGGGDSKQAVRARSDFLSKDYYRPVAEELCRVACEFTDKDGVVLDAGCGEGYYSVMMASNGLPVLGIDISKFATEAAAKRAKREGTPNAFFATASVFDMPVADASISTITNVFAPCAEAEYRRALADSGVLIVVYAGEEHLMGLKRAIYDTAHLNTPRADLPVGMQKVYETRVNYNIELDNLTDILSLFSMTPYYWRTSPSDSEKLSGLQRLTTEVDVMISVYKNTKEALE